MFAYFKEVDEGVCIKNKRGAAMIIPMNIFENRFKGKGTSIIDPLIIKYEDECIKVSIEDMFNIQKRTRTYFYNVYKAKKKWEAKIKPVFKV